MNGFEVVSIELVRYGKQFATDTDWKIHRALVHS